MPSVFIDGKEYTYQGNPSLIQFCKDNDVEIPHFCWHPAMSVPTNCRMCLVEVGFPMKDRATGEVLREADGSPKIGWGRKPVTSCNQAMAPDMYVRTNRTSQVIDKAQKGVLEFLLINHPLDCPICDQAGECPLQIWTYKYGPEGSRFEVDKVHKPKRIQLGANVTLDAERCINCTRCTRFTEEISKSWQLSIHSRGDRNYPATAPGKTFDDPYSMNVIDLCPVGALTSTDHRFKARVWEMNYTPTICTGCSNGCNVDVWMRDNRVMRHTPRHNADVNQYWMCDEGRLDYDRLNDNRVSGVKLKGDLPVAFEEGLSQTGALLKKHQGKILFIGSAHASVESNFALVQVAAQLGEKEVFFAPHETKGWGDSFLRKDDRTPNRAGCEMLGMKAASADELKAHLKGGKYELVYLMEDDRLAANLLADVSPHVNDKAFIIHAHTYFTGHEKATILLPAANHLESAGIFVNAKGMPQLAQMAKQIRRMTPDMWMAMPKSRLDSAGQLTDNWRSADNIVDCLPSWLLLSKVATDLHLHFAFAEHKDIFAEVKKHYKQLEGLKLSKRNRMETFKQSQFEFAIN
jgi:NADH-quinone oxidoreductase subunit G